MVIGVSDGRAGTAPRPKLIGRASGGYWKLEGHRLLQKATLRALSSELDTARGTLARKECENKGSYSFHSCWSVAGTSH